MNETNARIAERIARLEQFHAEGRLIRHEWTRVEEGREYACWLAALSPEAAEVQKPDACPAWLLPPWLANLVPFLDDAGSEDAWPEHLRRLAAVLRRIHVLTEDDWIRLDYQCRAIALREARRHVPETDTQTLQAIDEVLSLLDAAAAGNTVSIKLWAEAWALANAANASSAAWEAWAAVRAAGATAWATTWAASAAMARAAWAAKAAAWTAAASSSREAARAAADRIIDGMLSAIETACSTADRQ